MKNRLLYRVFHWLVQERYYRYPSFGYLSSLELPLIGTIGFRTDDNRLEFLP